MTNPPFPYLVIYSVKESSDFVKYGKIYKLVGQQRDKNKKPISGKYIIRWWASIIGGVLKDPSSEAVYVNDDSMEMVITVPFKVSGSFAKTKTFADEKELKQWLDMEAINHSEFFVTPEQP